MAKNTTPAQAQAAPKTASDAIDISKLTPTQLAALQKQLKEKNKTTSGNTKPRFELIDKMLKEKEGDGFKHTTRDIFNALLKAGLVNTTVEKYDQNEIKKIQARKQFLEKATDKAGKLVHPAGTFGYKPTEGGNFALSPLRIVAWFEDKDNVEKLTDDQREVINQSIN